MNKEYGFTLVELMAVLVVLGLLLLMSVPSITGTLQRSKERKEEEYSEAICTAAKSYYEIERDADGHKLSLPRSIKLSELISKEYIKSGNVDKEDQDKCIRLNSNFKCGNITNCS